ncbi:MAG TPA: alpha/beta hydrolase [Pyrinomonadaceae bacterium]|nr:alpha/beta hydrolase [Pyrinomonadaceae bacterium]
MKRRLSVFTLVVFGFLGALPSAAQPQQESWTGGFWLNGNWVAVLVRFNRQDNVQGGTADVILPFYGGSENAINVTLEAVKETASDLHFEIPAGTRRLVFDGRRRNQHTIAGNYVYDNSKGKFGLTRWAAVPVEELAKYYGAYRVSSDRVISIFRGWSYARTLNYVDYKTGRVGTLWPSSETEFFGGDGLAVSFPVSIRLSFRVDPAGNVKGLVWKTNNESNLTAKKIQFKEERITFTNGDIKLGGTLILPPTKEPKAVVIVTPGDYGTNRNQLRMWAHNFVSRGMAALIFDSRGAGESTGPVNSSSFSDLANDVLAGVQVLKKRADINPKKIGLFGFSNSAFIVTFAASRSDDVSFLILQSLVGVPGWEQETFRAETQLRVDEFPERDVKKGADFMRLKYEVARTGNGWDQLQKIIQQAGSERWLGYTSPPNSLERLRQVYGLIMTYDPGPALEKLKIPILAVWGGRDTFVPVPKTIAVFKRAMAKAGNKNYVIKIYANGSHSLLETATGSPSTGGKETVFSPRLYTMEGDWLLRNVSPAR